MSKNVRIIPRLDIKGPNLVKGIHLEGLRVLGKPEHFARYYYETGADELVYMDVVASLYNRNSLHDVIARTAKEIFIPLVVGGGIRTVDDIKNILRAGADKVILNTAAINRSDIIQESARTFGSSTIVIAIEAIKQQDGRYLAYTDNGREHTGIDVLWWAKMVEELGAGEIILTSVDRDGTGVGFDIDLISMVTNAVSIPVVAHGGAGCVDDICKVFQEGKVQAAAIASLFHYDCIRKNVADKEVCQVEGNVEFLKSGRNFSKINPLSMKELKDKLYLQGIACRM